MFHYKDGACSIASECFDRFTQVKPDYPNISMLSEKVASLGTVAMLACDGDWATL